MNNLCNICKEQNNNTSIYLKCKHMYHRECILSSIKYTSNECPYCRKYICLTDKISTTSTICKAVNKYGKNNVTQIILARIYFVIFPKKLKN